MYRNEIIARWSVKAANVTRTQLEKGGRKKAGHEETDQVEFWPGGRLKTHGEDVAAEFEAICNWYPDGASPEDDHCNLTASR